LIWQRLRIRCLTGSPPYPKPEMLDELKQVVNEQKADLGVATDMDGDRITVYRNGFVSGDKLFGVLHR